LCNITNADIANELSLGLLILIFSPTVLMVALMLQCCICRLSVDCL